MRTGTIEITTPGGAMPAYEAVPDEPRGALVIVQEIFGVTDHIEDVTRRAATAGFHAVAPHVFHRTGAPKLPYDDVAQAMPHLGALTDDLVLADVDAAIAHLSAAGWGTPQIGLVGFCWGGRASFLVATARPLGAAIGFYGGGIVTARFPQFPPLLSRAADLKAPWLGIFGGADASIPAADVDRLRTELDVNTSVAHELVVYDGAGHGFHCDARPQHYDEAAAKAAWAEAVGWLDAHLQTRPPGGSAN